MMIVYHLVFMASIYFHLYNICGFTSSVSCMTSEIVDSVMKNNSTYRDQKLSPHDVNMTSFMNDTMDLLVFRVVNVDPYQASSQQISRLNYKAHYLSPNGNVKQTRGSTHAADENAIYEQKLQTWDEELQLKGKSFGQKKNIPIVNATDIEQAKGEKNDYWPYPIDRDEDLDYLRNETQRFTSMILNEEMTGFNLVASTYTEDILETMKALNATKASHVDIKQPDGKVFLRRRDGEKNRYVDIIDTVLDNLIGGEFFVSLMWPTESPETEWVYVYSRNQTLLEMSIEELGEVENLKGTYV